MSNPTNPGDGTYVVVQNGSRVTKATESQQEAQAEADKRNKLQEGSGQPVPEDKRAAVKQNLFGAIVIWFLPVVSLCATTCMNL